MWLAIAKCLRYDANLIHSTGKLQTDMNILGINSFFEHPSVALICDGKLVFAIEDERLSRIKHGKSYTPYKTFIPFDSIFAALKSQGLKSNDIHEIAYSYNRMSHLKSLLGCFTKKRLSSISEELAAYRSASNVRVALSKSYEVPQRYRQFISPEQLGAVPYKEWDHHLCHAASTFYCSSFQEALVVVADGSGENACTSFYIGKNNRLIKIAQISLPNSLGFFYSYITSHLGFEPFSDEYKVMGLAAYGEPKFESQMNELVSITSDGKYRVDIQKLQNLAKILGVARLVGSSIEQNYSDIACSAQMHLEKVLKHIISYQLKKTGMKKLCLAGGVFLNVLANAELAKIPGVQDIFIQPASHDAGTAIGAAALSWIKNGGSKISYDSMFLGTEYDDVKIENALIQAKANYIKMDNGDDAVNKIADLLSKEKVIGLFRNRMEFGPRSLGNRSIIASPKSERTREKLNELKDREQFRPLAPIVIAEAFHEFFEGVQNRYMMLTSVVKPHAREKIPAVVHKDGTSRVQVVHKEHDSFLHALLERFSQYSGVPVLINTSLNVRGKPIDESPHDALASFFTSGLDYLFMGSFLVKHTDK